MWGNGLVLVHAVEARRDSVVEREGVPGESTGGSQYGELDQLTAALELPTDRPVKSVEDLRVRQLSQRLLCGERPSPVLGSAVLTAGPASQARASSCRCLKDGIGEVLPGSGAAPPR